MVDGINPDAIQWVGATNPLGWSATQELTGVEFRQADPAGGVRCVFPGGDVRWGEVTPAGWDGPITHAICVVRRDPRTGRWLAGCALEFYRGKVWTGAPLDQQWQDWFSRDRDFPGLNTLGNVIPGEEIGFFVVAGSLRLKDTSVPGGGWPPSVHERSNIVRVTFTPNGLALGLPPVGGPAAPSVPTEPSAPTPTPTPSVPSVPAAPGVDPAAFAALQAEVAALRVEIQAVRGVATAAAQRPIPTHTQPTSATIFGIRLPIPAVPLTTLPT